MVPGKRVSSDLIQQELTEVIFSGDWIKKQTKKKSKEVPLVITY